MVKTKPIHNVEETRSTQWHQQFATSNYHIPRMDELSLLVEPFDDVQNNEQVPNNEHVIGDTEQERVQFLNRVE